VARFFHPLILMLASMGKSELARQVQYLKAENEILRAKLPKRVDNCPLTAPAETPALAEGKILCRERLGGLLRHYYRQAA
jgi:hypothetical protein